MGKRSDAKRRPSVTNHVFRRSGDVRGPTKRDGAASIPDNPVWLTASEIGSFAFCPQAWYLERRYAPVTDDALARREAGRVTHRELGRETDLIRVTDVARLLLLLIILAALVLVAMFVLRAAR